MKKTAFQKILSANDTGESGGHQAGVLIPKGNTELIQFLPALDGTVKNPSVMLVFISPDGEEWVFRYVYYNNKLHDATGTRNEYRITGMTAFFRKYAATAGNILRLSGSLRQLEIAVITDDDSLSNEISSLDLPPKRIKLRGWRRVH